MNSKHFGKMSREEKIFHSVNVVLMLFLSVITLYPMLYVVFASFSDPIELSKAGSSLLFRPAGFSLVGYQEVMASENIRIGFRNTIFYVVVGTSASMILTVLGAYCLSQKDWLLRKPFIIMIMITMYFGGGMIPTFLVVKELGLLNTVWAIIIPGALSTYNMIVLRTSFDSLPNGLVESAIIDGAGHWTILTRIVLPLSKGALATIALFYAVSRWNDWYSSLIYLPKRRDLYSLQMFLREVLILDDQLQEVIADPSKAKALAESMNKRKIIEYATVVVATVPILCVYPFLQKYFVKGVMVGSIKG